MSDQDQKLRTICALVVDHELAGRSVGDVLIRAGEVSQNILRRAKRHGEIRLNGDRVQVSVRVKAGDVIELLDSAHVDPSIEPEPVQLRLVYEDARFIVVDKPAGLLVHPVKKHRSGTIANGLVWLYRTRSELSGIHPVHRLDRGTSGLVVIAKDSLTHSLLARELETRELTRSYLALVHGVVEADSGTIELPLELAPGSFVQRRPAVDHRHGKKARTRYQVVERMPHHTLLEIALDTGRTHQIRVHMAAAGHPIVGDSLYGPSSDLIGRQALHAYQISLVHPGYPRGWAMVVGGEPSCDVRGQRMTLTASLPEDLMRAIRACSEG